MDRGCHTWPMHAMHTHLEHACTGKQASTPRRTVVLWVVDLNLKEVGGLSVGVFKRLLVQDSGIFFRFLFLPLGRSRCLLLAVFCAHGCCPQWARTVCRRALGDCRCRVKNQSTHSVANVCLLRWPAVKVHTPTREYMMLLRSTSCRGHPFDTRQADARNKMRADKCNLSKQDQWEC
jgi:hypothetical protein